jgi:Protein of unknown function, DUF547
MARVHGLSQRIVAFALLIALAACSTLAPIPKTDTLDPSASRAGYERVLQRFVNDQGEVDFAALQKDRADLDRYVAFVANTPAESFTNANDRLAYYINSYNALSMYNVIDSGIPHTHAGLNKLKFFVLKKFNVGGKPMSLYAYENDVIRKLNEPRVHFALNCSAVSCPQLPRVPFKGDALDRQLEIESLKFFARPENLKIDHALRQAFTNEILKFYSEDFAPSHAPTLIDYINRYAPEKIPADYQLRFIEYDWTVANSQRSNAGMK